MKDKQQAIKLEKRLEHCRNLKKNLQELLSFKALSEPSQSSHSEFESVRSSTHVEALGILDPKLHSPSKHYNLSMNIVDVSQYNSDGIKVINSGDDMYEQEASQGQSTDHKSKEITQLFFSPTTSQRNDCSIDDKHMHDFFNRGLNSLSSSPRRSSMFEVNDPDASSKISSPLKPRLIRSNSYTLETPSPILLAHLQNFNENMNQENVERIEKITK